MQSTGCDRGEGNSLKTTSSNGFAIITAATYITVPLISKAFTMHWCGWCLHYDCHYHLKINYIEVWSCRFLLKRFLYRTEKKEGVKHLVGCNMSLNNLACDRKCIWYFINDSYYSIEFDRDDELFATAGVSRRIKVFDFSSVSWLNFFGLFSPLAWDNWTTTICW